MHKYRQLLLDSLHTEIGNREVVLLDLPNHANSGDQLIYQGELELLAALNKYPRYESSRYFFNANKIKADDCILMHGGGNMGDLYPKHEEFRRMIAEEFRNNKIVMLPQTVHFQDARQLEISANIYAKHDNLTLCARDFRSLDIFMKHFSKNKILCLPDAAFGIRKLRCNNPPTKKVLLLQRADKESSIDNIHLQELLRHVDVSDWPSFENHWKTSVAHNVALIINIAILHVLKLFGLHWKEKHDVFGLVKLHNRQALIDEAVNFLCKYDTTFTTRLHGHILAEILHKKNVVVDNNYGKNREFFEAWSQKSHYAKMLGNKTY